MSEIVVEKDVFVSSLIDSLSRFGLEYSPIQIVKEDEDTLIGVSHSSNKSILGHVILNDVKGDPFDSVVLKDSIKLKSAFSFINEPIITLELNKSFLAYDGDSIKIKSFMLDKRAFDDKQPIKAKKALEMDFDSSFIITNEAFLKIKKSKEFSQSDKIYIDLKNNQGVTVARKDDKQKSVGNLSFKIADSFNGEEVDNLPFGIDIFDLIQNRKDDILVSVNHQYKLLLFQQITEKYQITYITTAIKD